MGQAAGRDRYDPRLPHRQPQPALNQGLAYPAHSDLNITGPGIDPPGPKFCPRVGRQRTSQNMSLFFNSPYNPKPWDLTNAEFVLGWRVRIGLRNDCGGFLRG